MDVETAAKIIRDHEIVARKAVNETSAGVLFYTPTDLKVVTMNIMATTSLAVKGKPAIILDHLVLDHFQKDLNSVPGIGLKRNDEGRRRKNAREFGNSVALSFKHKTISNRVTVKVFRNGRFQVSGCKNIDDFVMVSRATCLVISNILDTPITLLSFEIGLMNMHCYVRSTEAQQVILDLKEIEKCLKNSEYWSVKGGGPLESVELSADRAPAIMIKYRSEESEKAITAMVYRRGRVVFTGLKKHTDTIAVHKFILDLIDVHWHAVASESEVGTTGKTPVLACVENDDLATWALLSEIQI